LQLIDIQYSIIFVIIVKYAPLCKGKNKMKKLPKIQFFDDIYYSFPVQLLLNHFKKNQILLLLWLLLFSYITQSSGSMLGIPYLFLDPEYINEVNYRSFFLVGVSIGIFYMAFHITTYILDSYRFNFLGTLARPFTKFCLNNSTIPLAFTITYVVEIVNFQFSNGFKNYYAIFLDAASFVFGIVGTQIVLFIYFRSTNKDIFKELASNLDKTFKRNTITRVNVMKKFKPVRRNKYKINYYIDLPLKVKKVDDEANHYEKSMLVKIFDQNHLNAVIVEIIIIIVIIILGLFRDNAYFQIPAAASAILFFSIFVMFTGAFSYWLRGWAITTLIAAIIIFNILLKNEWIKSWYQAFGINYSAKPALYSIDRLNELSNDENYFSDEESTITTLENWRNKFSKNEKPKIILICVSGGGQRAAAWTMRSLQYIDSSLHGELLKHSILITGASGGIVGASYYRELYLEKLQGKKLNIYNDRYYYNITKDILNPMIFSLVVNDIFFRFQKFSDGKYEYLKDRGYAFEMQLNRNLEYAFSKRVSDYKKPEENGIIPMVIMSPTVINDGRKLFISPLPISYMTTADVQTKERLSEKIKGIEFMRFFEKQDAANLSFLSALRMSATFPYITPNVELPSSPPMEIMDAGITDNFGVRDGVRFLYVFRDWIKENTGGVIFVEIRDSEKNPPIEKKAEPSIFQKMFSPIGSIYNNWDYLQDFNNDDLIEYVEAWYKGGVDVVDFQYIPKPHLWPTIKEKKINISDLENSEKTERAALSWHLTIREKESIKRTILEDNNQVSLEKLKTLLK